VSLDPSLKVPSGALATVRSVLTRAERLEKLRTDKGYDPAKQPALGLPKTRVARIKAGK